ncbi:MAG: adenylate/guanylate cyclase domain-containing protein [Gammaproteobacteria bacterium]
MPTKGMQVSHHFKKKGLSILTGIGWVSVFLALSIYQSSNYFKDKIDQYIYDYRINLSAHLEPPQNIIIVDIDEKSLKAEGHWPWSRSKLANLFDILSQSGVAVVATDMIFSEAEQNPISMIRHELKNISNSKIDQLAVAYDSDRIFAESLKKMDVVLGFVLHGEADIRVGRLPEPISKMDCTKITSVPTLGGYTANLEILQDNAVGGGFVTTLRDSDGVIRRVPMVICHEGRLYPSLSLMAVQTYLLSDTVVVNTEKIGGNEIINSIQLDDVLIPTDEAGQVLVTFFGPAKTIEYMSATDILKHEFSVEKLSGTLAFLGTSAFGLGDLQIVPQSRAFPGVEVHASIVASILDQSLRQLPAWHLGAEIASLFLVGILAALMFSFLPPISLILIAGSAITTIFLMDYYLFSIERLVFSFTYLYCLLLILTFHYMFVGYFFERRGKRQIESLFGQYVPPAQVKKMSQDPARYGFEGETKELTILFSDIRNFTQFSEHLAAVKVKQFLNEYFTPMTKVIFDSGGTIDKYIGDMIMAFWGAPMDDTEHRAHALDAALNMRDFSRKFLQQMSDSRLGLGIGLNTGTTHVGDMGSEFRRSYTVLGDAVNLASRLESATKYYQVSIIVSEETTKGQIGFVFKPLDRVKVKGKEDPVNIFELVGRVNEISDDKLQEIERFKEALEYFYAQQWMEAEHLLTDLCADYADCKVYLLYLERVGKYKNSPFNPDWDGVFVLRSK